MYFHTYMKQVEQNIIKMATVVDNHWSQSFQRAIKIKLNIIIIITITIIMYLGFYITWDSISL